MTGRFCCGTPPWTLRCAHQHDEGGVPVFTIDCPRHGATTLIWPSGIDAVRNTRRGIEVAYHCTCGHRGVYVTGRATAGATAA